MSRELGQRRLREALAVSSEWHEAADLAALPGLALPGIQRLVGGDAVGWNAIDLRAGTLDLVTVPADATFMADLPLLEALIAEHPLVPVLTARPGSPPLTWADAVPGRVLRRRQIYQDFFRPHEIGTQLAFAFSSDPWIGIAINRRRGEFSAGERELAELLRKHLRGAHRSLAARDRARSQLAALERGVARVAGAVLLVTAGDRVEYASDAARALLDRWFASAGRASLPLALAGMEGGVREFRRPGATLRATHVRTDPALLLLDESRRLPDPRRGHELGLTRRETEVLCLVARGLADAEVAAELAISIRTVRKHLEHAYAKLGVGDRRAASELLLRSP